MKTNKCQNITKVKRDDKGKDKKNPARARKVASKPRRYKLPEGSVSGKDSGLGGEVHGVREGTGKYDTSKGTSRKRKDSTRPLDSTRYFDTALGIKKYSEVAEILAVAVTKTIEALIERNPADIDITPEWLCKLHGDIAGLIFPDWAGRFRDVNVQVGTHIPPPYFEVPIHVRQYCDDLSVRLSFVEREKDIEKVAEAFAYADWRFQWMHPFRDFNGRVGRILLSAILFKLRLPPAETASVEPTEKGRYLKALHFADEGDLLLLTEIWIERLSQAFKEKRSDLSKYNK